jgi:hypothetical protein
MQESKGAQEQENAFRQNVVYNGFGDRQAYMSTTLKLGQTIKVADKASTGQA